MNIYILYMVLTHKIFRKYLDTISGFLPLGYTSALQRKYHIILVSDLKPLNTNFLIITLMFHFPIDYCSQEPRICPRRDHIERSVSEGASIISYLLRCTFFAIFIAIAYYRSIVAVSEFVIILVTSWDLVYNDVIGTTFAPLIKVVRTQI